MTISAQTVHDASESVIGELAAGFQQLPLAQVAAVVREAERDLVGQVTPGSVDELLHRLAAYRLEELAARY